MSITNSASESVCEGSERVAMDGEGWRELIEGQKGSGKTVKAYCEEAGVSCSMYYRWGNRLGLIKSQLGVSKRAESGVRGKFVELGSANSAVGPSMPWELEVALPGGEVVRAVQGISIERLSAIVQVLGGRA